MKKQRSLMYHIVVFVIAQIAWLSLLGLWIYRFVSSQLILNQVGDQISSDLMTKGTNIFTLVSGCVLFVAVSVGMSLIFRYFTIQFKMTQLYDNFIANVTHELKSPLASIQLYLETLQSRDVPKNKLNEFVGIMIKDATRLNSLIGTILEIAGLEQKKLVYQCEVYVAESVVRSMLIEAAARFKLPDNTIIVTGEAPCDCVVEKNAFQILIDNLVDNAVKYSETTPKIEVHLACTNRKIKIDFKDSGIGISSQDQKRIFNKFYRAMDANMPNVKGSGLGLYWVREIVKYHGGSIGVSSDGTGKGSTFHIELPIYRISKKRYLNQLLRQARERAKGKMSNET